MTDVSTSLCSALALNYLTAKIRGEKKGVVTFKIPLLAVIDFF